MTNGSRVAPFSKFVPEVEEYDDLPRQNQRVVCEKHETMKVTNKWGQMTCIICCFERFCGIDFGSFEEQDGEDGVEFEFQATMDWFDPEEAWR